MKANPLPCRTCGGRGHLLTRDGNFRDCPCFCHQAARRRRVRLAPEIEWALAEAEIQAENKNAPPDPG